MRCMRSKRCWMQSDFVPEKLKKAKWEVTKRLEIAQEKQKALEPKRIPKRSWWHRLKLKLFGL